VTNETRPRHVSPNFITDRIETDLAQGVYPRVLTRFPPEPNGYLHIGHAKSICLNFGLALDYGGGTNLRMDDTNPEKEDMEYALAIRRDVEWLGFSWERELFASDYYDWLYECAEQLITDGKAYVDSVSEDEMRRLRGTTSVPGQPSLYRDRTVEENLNLFRRMKAGEFPNGAHVLRARIDLAHPNFKLRDPVLYRILHAEHYRTGSRWCIYPMYDFAHPLSDYKEGISHSICTLEFENNRAIYDWLCENLRGKSGLSASTRPYQHEFARLNLEYTVMSKRKLLRLVNEGYVAGWDDPRMPTLSGFRRRGVTPEAIRDFANRIGVAKANNRVEMALLEAAIRDDLNHRCPRVMAVLRPVKVVLTNLAAEEVIWLEASLWPHDVPRQGSRPLPLTREIYIEMDDFALEPPRGFKRLSPGACVRLRHSQVIRCDRVVTDDAGQITHLEATLLPPDTTETVRGVIHWVSAHHNQPATFRLFDRLFVSPDPEAFEGPFTEQLNPASLEEIHGYVEAGLAHDNPATRYQFERVGYFWPDPVLSRPEALVFNRIVTLRDSRPRDEANRATPARPQPQRPAPTPEAEPDPERDARYQARLQQAGSLEEWRPLVEQTLAQYPDRVAAYRAGKTGLLGFFVGQAMRQSGGQANAAALQQLFQEVLDRG
jgi:glutaminyl-tRNA synthetase